MSISTPTGSERPDHAHFSQLYSDHHGWLFRWLQRKLGCIDQAENLTQDTFCRLLTFNGLLQIEEPRAFLTTTASRLIIDNARRKQVEQRYLEMYFFYHGDEQLAPSAEELTLITEALTLINRMLEGLPAKCQQAFLMNRLDGLRHAEIAEQLDISRHTVKKYIARAMVQCYHIVYEDDPLAGEAAGS